MGESRRKFDRDFREGAVRLVRETDRPIAQVARDLGINEGTLGNWVNADRRRRGDGNGALGEDERAELAGCGGRTPSWRWSVMCSSARWPSGSYPDIGIRPTMPSSGLCRYGVYPELGQRFADRHNQRLSRNASSESEGRKRPGLVVGGLVRASACSLSLKSAWR